MRLPHCCGPFSRYDRSGKSPQLLHCLRFIVSHCCSLLHFQIIKKAGESESGLLPDSPACLKNGICSYENSGAFFEKPEQIKKGTAVLALQAVETTANAGDLSQDIKSHLWTDSFSRSHSRVNCGTSTVVNLE